MRKALCWLVLVALAFGCAKKSAKPADTPLARDVDRICHAEEHSGALEIEEAGRAVFIATWLAQNLESKEGRALTAELSQMPDERRAERMKAEAKKHGIEACAIVNQWQGK